MTRDKVIKAMRLAGLSDDQIEAALARLDLADKVTKMARALWQLGKGQKVTFEVEGQVYRAQIGDLTFDGLITPTEVKPRQSRGQGQKDSARKILEDLSARRGYVVTEAALKYAAAYIQRNQSLQDALKRHPDLWERVIKLGILR
jgi:hypothetical protein